MDGRADNPLDAARFFGEAKMLDYGIMTNPLPPAHHKVELPYTRESVCRGIAHHAKCGECARLRQRGSDGDFFLEPPAHDLKTCRCFLGKTGSHEA